MKKNKIGFTLAEVLITLTVIGVVAAITIPALMQNVDERAWKAQKKALHVRLTNAIMDMPRVKGYGEYKEETIEGNKVITDTAAETFLVEGLSKHYKMTNICGTGQLEKCGLPEKLITLNGTKKDFPKTWNDLFIGNPAYFSGKPSAAAFQTPNGESVATYYNPNCTSVQANILNDKTYGTFARTCATFVYDLNGPKNPNQFGKDIGFISVIFRDKIEVVAPEFYEKAYLGTTAPIYSESGNDALSLCKNLNKNLRLPTVDELIAISSSGAIANIGYRDLNYWSSLKIKAGSEGKSAYLDAGTASIGTDLNTNRRHVLCVLE